MEDFIYIVLLIAWVVFAFYRRSRKKAEAARQLESQPETEKEYRRMPTLEEILMGEEIVMEEKPQVQPAPSVLPPLNIPVVTETVFEKEYKRRGISSIEELSKKFSIDPVQKDEITDVIQDPVGTDQEKDDIRYNIRQAVIYSEILNRPYV